MLKRDNHITNTLLYAISQGDTKAFTQLFDNFKQKVYTLALKITHSNEVAEDIVQEVFSRIWLSRAGLPEVVNVHAWIMKITQNCLFTWLKKKARFTITQLKDESLSAQLTTEMIDYKEADLIIKKALNKLPPQQHKVYMLIKESGMKREEVAEKLNLSPETVKVHLSKAIKTIRAYCVSNNIQLALIVTFGII